MKSLKQFAGVLVLVGAGMTLQGCAIVEYMCGDNEYPVKYLSTEGQLVGGRCVPDADQPPVGFLRYPADLEPEKYLDDAAATREWQARLDRASGRTPAPHPS